MSARDAPQMQSEQVLLPLPSSNRSTRNSSGRQKDLINARDSWMATAIMGNRARARQIGGDTVAAAAADASALHYSRRLLLENCGKNPLKHSLNEPFAANNTTFQMGYRTLA